MTTLPTPDLVAAAIDAAHEARAESPRGHMGCSVVGHPCDRWLWLSFRFAARETFSGRMLRLFRRGHNEEATIVADLRSAGMDVTATGEQQSRVDLGCHLSGSIDGIIKSGVPDAPRTPHVLECKTHSLKSFNALAKDGVEKSKPAHFVQMQLYMMGMKLDRALYVSVCKDDDRLYSERVRYDAAIAERYVKRAHRIALANRIPEPLSRDPSWYECKFCAAYDMCHQSKPTRHVNCRTCAHSTATPDSTWRCEKYGQDVPYDFQQLGCDAHILHPDLVPWEIDGDASSAVSAVWIIDGKRVKNGAPAPGVYTSREILANATMCAAGDPIVEDMRVMLDARIE